VSAPRLGTVIIRLFGTLTVLAAGLAVLMFLTGAGKLPGGPYAESNGDHMNPVNAERLERAFTSTGRDRRFDVRFVRFRQDGDREYVVVVANSRQGPVYLHVRVLDWDPTLRDLRDRGGHAHATLRGFSWDHATLGTRRELIYRGMDAVAD